MTHKLIETYILVNLVLTIFIDLLKVLGQSVDYLGINEIADPAV